MSVTPTIGSDVTAPTQPLRGSVRPVLLFTLNVPFDPVAVAFAVETAAETGADLLVCDGVGVSVGNPAVTTARTFGDPETRAAVKEVAREARSCGIRTTRLVFHHPRPVMAALQVARDENVGLFVFGSDAKRLGRWQFRRAVRRILRDATCLAWANESLISPRRRR